MGELIVQEEPPLLKLCLSHPEKRNCLTPAMLDRLADTLFQVVEEKKFLIPILRGQGERFFSAGYDLSEIKTMKTESSLSPNREKFDRVTQALQEYPYPTIAMLNGSVYGGGCELAFACDFRYAAEHVTMCFPPAKLGVVYPLEGLNIMVNVMGLSNVRKMLLTAQEISVEKLLDYGAVDAVFSSSKLENEVRSQAMEMGKLSPTSLQGNKYILRLLGQKYLDPKQRKKAEDSVREAFESADMKEALQAFFEKRTPNFQKI